MYYGTPGPTFAPLTPGQVMAVGRIGACSGTLIAPTWVLTAQHCQLRIGDAFCIGPEPNDPNTCVEVAELVPDENASSDLLLARLQFDPSSMLPEIEPIPVITEALSDDWKQEIAEGAGYGENQDKLFGTRAFTAEPIVDVDGTFIYVDGEGVHGLCGGDSGGPLLVIASDNTARVAGALYGGDSSCVGVDQYSRVDSALAWIEQSTGPTEVGDPYCGPVDAIGMCSGERAIWCASGQLTSETCPAEQACAWDDASGGFRCLAGDDPCEGLDRRGACDGSSARWCVNGVVQSLDCDSCTQRCAIAGSPEGAYCLADPCGGLDFLGRCTAAGVAEWCQNGEIRSIDCAERGETCDFIDSSIGYYCTG